MSKDIEKYIQDNAKFLTIMDGQTVKLIYKGYEIIADRFTPGKDVISYLFQYTDSDKTIPWNKASNKVAMQMANMAPGDIVSITRSGEGPKTTYKIEKVKK